MNAVLNYTSLITLSVELIMGILGNAFTVLVNIMDWVKRRKISFLDQILTALAISRIALLFSMITSLLVTNLYPTLMMTRRMLRIVITFWTVTNHFSIWLATCLSIFYFLKIASYSNSIFFHLKWRVKKVVLMALLASLLLLCLNILLIYNIFKHIDGPIDEIEAGVFYNSFSNNSTQFPRLVLLINTMFTLTPFTVSLTMFLLLIFSLWRHLKNMQHSIKGSRDVSTRAHIKALKTVFAFLLLYTIFFLSHSLQFWNTDFQKKHSVTLFFWVIGVAFPSGHSYVLILGNTKLKQAFLSMPWWPRCRPDDREPSGS